MNLTQRSAATDGFRHLQVGIGRLETSALDKTATIPGAWYVGVEHAAVNPAGKAVLFQPPLAEFSQQFFLTQQEGAASRRVAVQRCNLALQTNKLGPFRLAVLLQPVRKNEPWRIVVWRLNNAADEITLL